MKKSPPLVHEVDITTLVYGGNGLGTLPDGRKIFIPFSLPGERLRIEIVNEKKNYCFGTIKNIIKSSPARIQPRCKHFGLCGGCHLQHISYDDQLAVKVDMLVEQLKRHTKLENIKVDPIVPAPIAWEYRNHIQFHPTNTGNMAFLGVDNKNVEIQECHLFGSPINQLWDQLDLDPESNIELVSWRVNEQQEVLLLFEGWEADPPDFEVDFPLNVVYLGENGPIALSGNPYLIFDVKQQEFQVSAESFFQVNTGMINPMVDFLLEKIQPSNREVVMDVYCGVGLFSKFFAKQFHRCIGVELSTSAVEDFVINLDGFDHVEIYLGAAEEVLPALEISANVILVDPPRSGLAKNALHEVLRKQPETIGYISCDMSSFIRDVQVIQSAGYQLENLVPYDLFPQTYHLETIGIFHRQK